MVLFVQTNPIRYSALTLKRKILEPQFLVSVMSFKTGCKLVKGEGQKLLTGTIAVNNSFLTGSVQNYSFESLYQMLREGVTKKDIIIWEYFQKINVNQIRLIYWSNRVDQIPFTILSRLELVDLIDLIICLTLSNLYMINLI